MQLDDDTAPRPFRQVKKKRHAKQGKGGDIDEALKQRVLTIVEKSPNMKNRPKAVHRALRDRKVTLEMVGAVLASL